MVFSICPISKGNLLLGKADGLYHFVTYNKDYSLKKIKLSNQGGEFNRVYKIVKGKPDEYWIGTNSGVALYNHKTKTVELFKHYFENKEETIVKGVCRVVYKDQKGNIWFATSSGGLNQLKEEKGKYKIVPYQYNDKIKTPTFITSILIDEKGTFWLGTLGSGLIKWEEDKNKITTYNRKNGLPNDVVYGVLSDNKGNIWFSTNRGLCMLNIKSENVRVFTEAEGMMSREFNFGAYFKNREGMLFFGGVAGYNFFYPENLKLYKRNVDVIFTHLLVEGKEIVFGNDILKRPISETEQIILPYSQRSFSLLFQPTDISKPDLINFKYVLEYNGEKQEVLIGSGNEINFPSLSRGEYVLKVYARIGEGEWSVYPAELKIIIKSPFWSTWYFITGIGVLLLLMIQYLFKKRAEESRKKQVLLEVKIKERTKEIVKKNKKIEQQKRRLEEKQKELEKEKEKTEKLLKNVIPESTANELIKRGRVSARSYSMVSVMFTDFVGFTKISGRIPPSELVKKLDVYFRKFDEIIIRNNLEKIKTIGDAYMCAGGVPVRNKTNPIDTCLAGIQIQDYMLTRQSDAIANGREYWELRLGINTGEVTAGVIGRERLAFDIWGETVNVAQRMEMLGKPGKVTITGDTFQYIEPYFECVYVGKAETKNHKLVDIYEVIGIKKELSKGGKGVFPNAKFHKIVELHHYSSINYYKAERYIHRVLKERLSESLHYHRLEHTLDVVNAVERIALEEGVTDEGLFLLKTAASYHDAGFVEKYEDNEEIGVRMAQEILPKFGYTQEHVDKIKELIYVTKIPHNPKNKLEEIICDADLDYLGRDDFHEIASRLCKELIEHGKISSKREWDEIQVKFLKSHKYFTKTAIRTRAKKKEQNLKEVEERLKRNQY